MPEIAEVRTVAKTLNERISHSKIKDIDILYPNIIEDDLDYFKKCLIGKEIKKVSNYGKYLLFDLGDKTLISHLRMEGKYFIKGEDEEVVKHEHIIFHLDDGRTLRYHDTRKFGRMHIANTDEVMSKELSSLGLEIDDPNLKANDVYERIHKRRKPIKSVLLDQTIINGLGNIYVDEVLFASKIHPETLASALSLKDCENIIREGSIIIGKATEAGGTTIRSYTSSLGVYGSYQNYLKVHTKEVCPECGSKILKIRVGGRGTYLCPKCQKRQTILK